jgi:hypothetical protein
VSHRRDALYQGTALAVPHRRNYDWALAPARFRFVRQVKPQGNFSGEFRVRYPRAKARFLLVMLRHGWKPCPDTKPSQLSRSAARIRF